MEEGGAFGEQELDDSMGLKMGKANIESRCEQVCTRPWLLVWSFMRRRSVSRLKRQPKPAL